MLCIIYNIRGILYCLSLLIIELDLVQIIITLLLNINIKLNTFHFLGERLNINLRN